MIASLSEHFGQMTGYPEWLFVVGFKVLIVAAVFLPAISVLAMMCIWAERKIAGHIQSRLGPKHVGPFGLLQSLADGAKLLVKEDLIPASADQVLFRLAPYLAFAPVFVAFLALPFGPQFVFEAGLNVGVLYLLAVLGLEVMGTILSGWASNSKWAIYGGMREACQIVSYEIPLGIAILCGVMVAGTMNLVDLNYLQGGGIQTWFAFHDPFIFMAFFIYFVASLASAKRAPFDLPESESELVAGFHTEYSGLRWSFFFFAEYAGMFVIGCIQAILFLGGWNSPLGAWDPVYQMLGYDPVYVGQQFLTGASAFSGSWEIISLTMTPDPNAGLLGGAMGLFALNAYGAFWVITKALVVIGLHMWIRWTLPRIRIDQVLHGCIKGLLPASLAMFVGVMIWLYLIPPTMGGAFAHGSTNIANLTGNVPLLQSISQWILTLIGIVLFAFYAAVMIGAQIMRKHGPRKGIFQDVMPVGNEIHFTRGPEYVPDEDRSLVKD